jgi:hypothetical protein
VDRNINDAESIWWFDAADFAKVAVRLKYFGIEIQGIDFAFYEDGRLHICNAYNSEDFQVEDSKNTEWYEVAAECFLKIAADQTGEHTLYYAPSYEISDELLRDFGCLEK